MHNHQNFSILIFLLFVFCIPGISISIDLQPGPLSQFCPTDFYSSSDGQVFLAGKGTSSWISRDGGSNWECLDIAIKAVNATAYSHIKPFMVNDITFVFICLYDGSNSSGMDVIASFDCGYTFEDRSPGSGHDDINPNSFLVHSEDDNTWMFKSNQNVFYTQNSGLNWFIDILDTDTMYPNLANDIYEDPLNTNTYYSLTNYDMWPRDVVARMGRIYRTTNGIGEWNTDEPFIDTIVLPDNYHICFGDFLALSNGQFLTLVSEYPYSGGDWDYDQLVKYDSGGHYTEERSGGNLNFSEFYFEDQIVPGRIYAKVKFDRFVHVSNDFGATWEELSTQGLPELENVKFLNLFQSSDGSTLFVSFDDFSMYESTNQGENWQPFQTFESSTFYSVFPYKENLFFSDGDEHWYKQVDENSFQHISIETPPDSVYQHGEIFYANGDTVVGIVEAGPMVYNSSIRLYGTYDGGETSEMIHDQDDDPIIPFYDRYRDQFILWRYIISATFFRMSFDCGRTWESFTGPYHPIPGWRGWRDPIHFYHNRFYTSSPLYSDDKMYIYANYLGEEEWTNLEYPDSLSQNFPRIIPDQNGCHVMGWDRKFYSHTSFGWEVISELPDSLEIPLHFEFIKSGPLGFIGYEEDASSFILSTNGGREWFNIEFVLPDGQALHSIGNFKQDTIRNRLWMSTSAGLYWYPVEDLMSSEETKFELIPADPNLLTNYPNPFNASTRITYNLKQAGNVKLDVYDITGRLVKTLKNENQPVGMHSVSFDGSGLASGTYFIRLDTGKEIRNRKITLVK